MNQSKKTTPASANYEVGYGKPPVHTRFKKGQSGNPRGRRRDSALERARGLVLKEAYRLVTVREGDNVISIPALQAILRSQVALAAKGNGPAQRALVKTVKEIERDRVEAAKAIPAEERPRREVSDMTIIEQARLIAFALAKGARLQKEIDEAKKSLAL